MSHHAVVAFGRRCAVRRWSGPTQTLSPSSSPERIAKTEPYQQVTETIGSGPFKFVAAEYQPGNKVVYVKNADYVPRSEPPSWASGARLLGHSADPRCPQVFSMFHMKIAGALM